MAVIVSAASNYQNVLGGMFGHVEIELLTGPHGAIELADNSELIMFEFGLIVRQPGEPPNQVIPWGSVRRIVEARVPAAQSADDSEDASGQYRD